MPAKALGDRTLDARQDRPDMRDRIYQPRLVSLPTSYPPKSWIETYLPLYEQAGLVLDQGSEGACTGFGLAALVNYIQFRRELESARTRGGKRSFPRWSARGWPIISRASTMSGRARITKDQAVAAP
jgi:hypothetical protein